MDEKSILKEFTNVIKYDQQNEIFKQILFCTIHAQVP
jgi:thermostable 8-oxoguanine DNA glycosylase